MMKRRILKPGIQIILVVALIFAGNHRLIAQQPDGQIRTGVVTDENGEPLTGASVDIKGTKAGTFTNVDGNFKIMAKDNDVLVISYLGYQSIDEKVNGRKTIDISMVPSAMNLEEVTVVGYGSQKKLDMTGSIVSIKGEELMQIPANNVLEALQGKIAGLQVINDSEPGAAPQVRIRGVGTFSETSPICVIDGQFFNVEDLATLNPYDIESVSVLKDASATAIYGSRGANGVIIVTTKQGSDVKGETKVNVNMNFSVANPERLLDLMNLSEWQQLKNLDFLADNWNNPDAANRLPYPDWKNAGEGFNWQKEILRPAYTQNYQASISGNSNKFTFFLSAGYLNQDGIIKESGYQRATTKFNISYQAYKFLKLGVNSTFTYDNQISFDKPEASEKNVFSLAGQRRPDEPNDLTEENTGDDYFSGGDNNPINLITYTHDRYKKRWRYITNFYADVTFLKNFLFRSSFTNTTSTQEGKIFLPAFMESAPPSANSEYKISRFYHNTSLSNSWLLENTLTYSLTKNKHRLTAMGGMTMQEDRTQYANLKAQDLPWIAWKNRNLWYIGQGKNISATDGGTSKTYFSLLSRVSYTYNDRYTMTATGRYDGSSAYPANNRFGFFPSLGLGWILSEEDFIKDIPFIGNLKIRGSYGVVGNDRGVSAAQMLYAQTMSVIMGQDNHLENANAIGLINDKTLTWEKAKTLNFGFEGSVWKDKLSFNFDVYNKITSDVMMPLNIPPSNFKVIYNIGTIKNTGMEWSLGYNQKLGKLVVNTMFTGSILSNKVTEIRDQVGPIISSPNRTVIGYPVGGFWGYQTIGVFQNEEQLAQMPKADGTRVGDLMFRDVNGDGIINQDDYVYLGSYLPKTLLGLTSKFSYKNITLNIDLNSSLGAKNYNRRAQYRQPEQNAMTSVLNAWTSEGSTNLYPRIFSRAHTSALDNDYFIEDASFLSIQNIQLSYSFPRKKLSRLNVSWLRCSLTGTNLYTFTNATGYKPDIPANGINANAGGIDNFGIYPNNRTFSLGLAVGF